MIHHNSTMLCVESCLLWVCMHVCSVIARPICSRMLTSACYRKVRSIMTALCARDVSDLCSTTAMRFSYETTGWRQAACTTVASAQANAIFVLCHVRDCTTASQQPGLQQKQQQSSATGKAATSSHYHSCLDIVLTESSARLGTIIH
jgi:hypothetical protein